MEKNNPKNEKTTRILYLAVVGVLIFSALIIGLVAALGKDETKLPTEQPPTEQTPTPTPTPDDGKEPDKETETTPDTYLAVSKRHDDSLPVYSATIGDFRVHEGIDIATEAGADVFATARGTVSLVWSDPLMGECLSIDHGNGVVSIYKNLATDLAEGIQKGATVTAGQKIATVGDGALIESAEEAHLHFEMTFEGKQVDPLTYISEDSAKVSLSGDVAYES